MTVAKFELNGVIFEKKTSKKDANFALVGRFDGGEMYVISLHKTADYGVVSNSRITDLAIAKRIA